MAEEWSHTVSDSFVNPEPIVLEESELIINDFISPMKLQAISGEEDLSRVTSLEMVVDTREMTLGNFGQYLPALIQLKLSDSVIPSVRDIGTSLSKLSVLWMSRCGLVDIDGIASIQSLTELYLAYNDIEDVSPISFLESLEVLDLEGNKLKDLEQLDYLAIMPCLSTLTISGNPICQTFQSQSEKPYTFREVVLEKMPNLQQLDDEVSFLNGQCDDARPSTATSSHSHEDIDIITNAIKEGNFEKGAKRSTFLSNDSTSPEPMSPARINRPRPATAGARRSPVVASPDLKPISLIQARPGSSGSESGILQQDDSSSLTFGDPLCGNPVSALRNKKKFQSPVLSLLTDNHHEFHSSRPATVMGLQQRPLKIDLKLKKSVEKINSDEKSFENYLFSASKVNRENKPSSSRTTPVDSNTSHSVSPPAVSSTSPTKSSSSALSKQLKTPTPPQRSPQRPKTACDFRASRYRRSLDVDAGQSTNLASFRRISPRNRASEPLRTQIEDPS